METKIKYGPRPVIQDSLPALYENVEHHFVALFYASTQGIVVFPMSCFLLGEKITLPISTCFDEKRWTRLPDGSELTLVQKST